MDNSFPSPASRLLESPTTQLVSEMDVLPIIGEDSSSLWDWSDLLDFSVDNQNHTATSLASDYPSSVISTNPEVSPVEKTLSTSASRDRIRKRDPRLTCSNFLAGRVPCACPEIDEKLEEEAAMPGKKRVRLVRAAVGMVQCQVPSCEADIRELKGYHRRHRVCLRCANASTVIVDGQNKRYCQQCGKFHILADFDEGRRSCRRKLQRHNSRRRRKHTDSKGIGAKGYHEREVIEDVGCGNEAVQGLLFESQNDVQSISDAEDPHPSLLCSVPISAIRQADSVASLTDSGEAAPSGGNEHSGNILSSVYHDKTSGYKSMCPTARISFKLYDWNPAEFPRRLRHQIFEWLASMPVELEGYIRPGCTVLTAFIAMPKFLWVKLSENSGSHVLKLVSSGGMLSGKGALFVNLNNKVLQIVNENTSCTEVETMGLAPRLHFVYPICFEAGQSMEFVACGSNLCKTNFRFLISFSGRYLAYESCVALRLDVKEHSKYNPNHQLFKIYVARTQPSLAGPAFIEVENEWGLSNFVPIIIAEGEVCSEMKRIQQRTVDSFLIFKPRNQQYCSDAISRLSPASDLLLDVAWLIRRSNADDAQCLSFPSEIKRCTYLLTYLLSEEHFLLLGKILKYVEALTNKEVKGSYSEESEMGLLSDLVDKARAMVNQKMQTGSDFSLHIGSCKEPSLSSVGPAKSSDMEWKRPYSCSKKFTYRPLAFVMGTLAVCLGTCTVLFHHFDVGNLTTSIRRCLFDGN